MGDVVEALPARRPLAYSSVLTMMRILEQKGYVEHEKESRAYVYRPLVNREQARRSVIRIPGLGASSTIRPSSGGQPARARRTGPVRDRAAQTADRQIELSGA